MTVTINAVASTGLVQTSDGSGVIKVQSNGVTTNALAWVNFNGTSGSTAIRASFNVSSMTRNGAGDYTVNFTNAMSDSNYVILGTGGGLTSNMFVITPADGTTPRTTSACRVTNAYQNGGAALNDTSFLNIAIFGN